MSDRTIVLALGFTWPDLSIEEKLLGAAGFTVVDGRGLAADDPLWRSAAGVMLGTAKKLGAAELRSMPNCKGVVRYGIGYDNVDVAAAEAQGVIVAIIRDYCIEEVAEHALACALSLARGLSHWDHNIRAGAWRSGERPRLHQVSRLNFGIVGFGLIGRVLAEKARALFGRLLVYDPFIKPGADEQNRGFVFMNTLADMLAEVDILSVHVPLNKDTRALIGAEGLALMKPSASVINVSRGGVIDEAALLRAVAERKLFGAALDTFVTEPLPATDPLMNESHIILTPHVAWLSEEAEVKLRVRTSEEMAKILTGEAPSSPVSKIS